MKTKKSPGGAPAPSIEERRREVKEACAQIVELVDQGEPRALAEVEEQVWTQVLAVGRAAMALFLARQAARPRPTSYEQAGVEHLVVQETTTSEIGTRFGKVPFARPVGRHADGSRGPRDLPVDRDLGLVSGFSLGSVLAMTRLCAQMAFASARATFASFCEWTPSQRTVLRMVDTVGAEARGFLEQAAPPPDDGDILVIQVDGRGAPMIDATEKARRCQPRRPGPEGTARHRRRRRRRDRVRPRRRKGDKSKNAKVAFVAVIYTLQSTDQGCEGPLGKRLVATFDSHEALFAWLLPEAKKRGYGSKHTLFIADGSEHIWRLQKQYLPDAEPCLDWYHVVEKLWEVGRCIHPEGSAELTAWIAARTRELRGRSGACRVFDALSTAYQSIAKTGPGTKTKRDKILQVHQHLAEHQHRLRYHDLRRRDLDIGSGAVEGAVRNLVGMRLDGPGMRWSRDRAERILHLRCIHLNGQWDDFAAYLARRRLQLAAVPVPTRTHDAKRQAA